MLRKRSEFPYLITNRSITISFDGLSHTIMKEDSNYAGLIAAIKEERWDDITGLLSPAEAIVSLSDGDMRVENNQVYVKKQDGGEFAVPSGLNTTILDYLNQQLPFQPLVKFAVNLSQNPSARSVEQLFSFIEKNKFTITEEGNFIAYKSIRSDFKDAYSGKFDNSIGKIVSMSRDQVDDDPNRTCSRGLHVANYDYAHNIYGGAVTVFVEVNPKDVVSVPVDYNNAKMRVCQYNVLGLSQGEMRQSLYRPEDEQDIFAEEELLETDMDCPGCGLHVSSSWELCPNCDEDLED